MRYALAAVLAAAALAATASAENWPHWRGPRHDGTSAEKGLPVRWTASENVLWRLAVPGRSGSTPIVWNDRVYVTVADGDALALWAVDRKLGKLVWSRPLGAGNVTLRKHNMSSPSPVTDGQALYVMTGTGILKSFDLSGTERWSRDIQKDYGPFGLNWGYASSPLLEGGALFVQVLHGMKTDDPSYLLRIDAKTGKTTWRVDRPTAAIQEAPDAYTTPALVRAGGRSEIVVVGGDVVTAHDPATGRELWRAGGLNPGNDPWYRIVASPVVVGDIVVASTRVRPMLAFRAGGSGDVTQSRRLWSFDAGPDVPTPVTDGTLLYVLGDKGLLSAVEVATGKVVYDRQRLRPGTYSASPVLADGRIYAVSEDGVVSVVKAGPTFAVEAENVLEEYTLSSPAISGGQIFLKTDRHLWAVGEPR